MSGAQKYSVNQHLIDTLLGWVKSSEIAIPEIQRPFVWDTTQVRDLLDSLYQGYPVGYIIVWKNPDVGLIAVGNRPPREYLAAVCGQCAGGPVVFGGISDLEDLRENFAENAVPLALLEDNAMSYEDFLGARRVLMAQMLRDYYRAL